MAWPVWQGVKRVAAFARPVALACFSAVCPDLYQVSDRWTAFVPRMDDAGGVLARRTRGRHRFYSRFSSVLGLTVPELSPKLDAIKTGPSRARRSKLPPRKRLPDQTRKPSQRQQRIIELVAQGLKNREIAKVLGIGEKVVRNYLSAIYDKIGVNNRVELALWFEARRHEGRLPPAA
jgi:DNA-binding CsgD family transcriptional regulator